MSFSRAIHPVSNCMLMIACDSIQNEMHCEVEARIINGNVIFAILVPARALACNNWR